MKFIKLTNRDNSSCWVKYESINLVVEYSDHSSVYLTGDSMALKVKETPEQIFDKINEQLLIIGVSTK